MRVLSASDFSDLIGSIYDCTIEPANWPATMQNIGTAIGCFHTAIFVLDLYGQKSRVKLSVPPLSRLPRKIPELKYFYRNLAIGRNSLDEPIVLSRSMDEETFLDHPIYREWAQPQGIRDAIQSIVLRDPARLGLFAGSRHQEVGVITDREIDVMRTLAPHIRRAVTISDLMDMKTLEARALSATLDTFTIGVVIVAEKGRILHANELAQDMFRKGAPIRSVQGHLLATDPKRTADLLTAVLMAQTNEVKIGTSGIGLPLTGPAGDVVTAHVLPLARGELRTRLVPQAIAGVFVTAAGGRPAPDLGAVAKSFGLTPAESRLLNQLAKGDTISKAAASLEVSEHTIRTHLQNIFAKTGVSRQTELIALLDWLVPPVRAA